MLLNIFLLVLGFVMLVKGADIFVDGAVDIARRFKIPEMVIGLTIVAMGTSAPEAAVSIAAALKGSADITIGNVLGSNILNILIILGVTSLVAVLPVEKSTVFIDMPFVIITSVILLLTANGGTVVWWEGAIFLLLLAGYMFYLYKKTMANPGKDEEDDKIELKPLWKVILFILLGIVCIVKGSDFAVDGATGIARALGLSDRFIGLTIVALGTSLPELVTSVTAAFKGSTDIAIGNIVGSNIFNILFVVGMSALITPVAYSSAFFADSLIAIGAAVLLFVLCLPKKQLNRFSGVVMLLCYAGYFIYLMKS